ARAESWLKRQGLMVDRPVNLCKRVPVCGSHSLAMPSSPPREARNLPSGENATLPTIALWASILRTSLPVFTSHSRTQSSQPPDASVLPSGANATEHTQPTPVADTSVARGLNRLGGSNSGE